MSSREVVSMPGISERKQAFMQAVEKSKKVEKTKVPVFRVEDGTLDGSSARDMNYEQHDDDEEEEGEESTSHSSNAHSLRSGGFFGTSPHLDEADDSEDSDDEPGHNSSISSKIALFGSSFSEIGLDPAKTQEVLKEEEAKAKSRFAALLAKFEPPKNEEEKEEPGEVTAAAFDDVQKKYLAAVEQLRPAVLEPARYTGPARDAVEHLKRDYAQEASKCEEFGNLQDRWHDYDTTAQDNRWYEWCVTAQDLPDLPSGGKNESDNEKEIHEKVEEVTTQWIDFTEKVVETAEKIRAESDDDLSIDSDMSKWKEEARRLKADAAVRKKRREAMLERRNRRKGIAAKRHEEYVVQKGVNDEGSRVHEQDRKDAAGNSRLREEEAENRRKRGDEGNHGADEDSTIDDNDSSGADEESTGLHSGPVESKVGDAGSKVGDASKPETEDAEKGDKSKKEKKKKAKKDKEKKDKSKKKDKDKDKTDKLERGEIVKSGSSKQLTTKKASRKLTASGPPCGDDDDMTDGPEEKNPRHFDGSLWKNPLKFWTNKPKLLNETGAKYIFKTLPRSDCFRRTEKTGSDSASFYWYKADGDFDVLVKIKGNFRSSYDKAGIMLRDDEKTWVLSGIEYYNGELNHSTCITRGISDWSLSPVPVEAKDGLWVCVKRSEGKVECFFSVDMRKWVQTRQGFFSTSHTLKVGIAAACPMGEPFKVVFERFKIKFH